MACFTAIVGRDPEIAATRPPNTKRMALNVFGVIDFYEGWKQMLSLSFGRLSAEVQDYVPSNQRSKACFVARIWLLIHLATIALAIVTQSILPLLVIGLPRLYGML